MSIFSKLGALIFAPTDAAGNPRQVINHDAQVWSTEVERIIQVALEGGDLLVYGSLSALNADLDHPAHTGAILIGESIADDGLYMKQGASGSGSWVKIGNVPGQGFVKATNAGAGTANAIAATTPVAVNETQLILLPITAANTASPVTVAFNGGAALTVKTVSGNDVAAGGLPAGSVMLGVVQGGDFRLLSDQASAGIQAAAEAAQVAAEAALAEMREKSVGAFPDNASADAFLTAEGLTKQKGTIYFNTTADVWRYWDGSAWQMFPYAIVADGGVTTVKLAPDAVTASKIDGSDASNIRDKLWGRYLSAGVRLFPRLAFHGVPLPQGYNHLHARLLDRGDGRSTIVSRRSKRHIPTNDAVLWAYDTRDDGQTIEGGSRPIYAPGGTYNPDLFIASMCNGRAVILTVRREYVGGSYTYLAPELITSDNPDEANWDTTGAKTVLTRDAALPANFGGNWHGEIYPWPAAEGGHDTNGWIAFSYSDGVIGCVKTSDNWTTPSDLLLAVDHPSESLTEMAVMGSTASGYTMFIRVNGKSVVYASFAAQIDGPWSEPVATTIPLVDAPPDAVTLSDDEAYLFIRSGKNTQASSDHQGHLMAVRIDPSEFYSSAGVSGFDTAKPFLNLGSWPSDYPQFINRGADWLMITSGGEQLVNTNATHGGASQVMIASGAPVPALSAVSAPAVILKPSDNVLPNGDWQVWSGATSGAIGAVNQEIGDCWRLQQQGVVTSRGAWSRQPGSRTPWAVRFGRTAGETYVTPHSILSGIKLAELYHLRGKIATFAVDVTAGADLSSTVDILVEYSATNTTISTTDGSYPGRGAVDQIIGAAVSAVEPTRHVLTPLIPDDAEMLTVKVRKNHAGTAGANDWLQVENAVLVPGNYDLATPMARNYRLASREVAAWASLW